MFFHKGGPQTSHEWSLAFHPYINGFYKWSFLGFKGVIYFPTIASLGPSIFWWRWHFLSSQTSSQVFDVVLVSAPGFSVMTWTNQQLAAECLLLDFCSDPKRIHGDERYIYVNAWTFFMVNVTKYTIHSWILWERRLQEVEDAFFTLRLWNVWWCGIYRFKGSHGQQVHIKYITNICVYIYMQMKIYKASLSKNNA